MRRRSPSLHWVPALSLHKGGNLPGEFEEATAWLRANGFPRVYVNVHYGEESAPPERLQMTINALQASGIRAGGLLHLTPGHFPGKETLLSCYTCSRSLDELEATIRRLACTFNEVVIAGGFRSECRCEGCRREKRGRSWPDARRSLMLRVAQERVLGPALEENPEIRIGVALPADYETASAEGYPLVSFSQRFHRIFVQAAPVPGAADPAESRIQDLFPSGFFLRWIAETAGRKAGGAMLSLPDSPASDPSAPSPDQEPRYEHEMEAVVEMTLSGATELALPLPPGRPFPVSQLRLESVRDRLPELEGLAKAAKKTPVRGVAAYLPYHAHPGEDRYLFDRLRRLGLPLRPTPRFPSSSRSAFFTLHALEDRDLGAKLATFFAEGGAAYVSCALAEALTERGEGSALEGNVGVWPPQGGFAETDGPTGVQAALSGALDAMRQSLLAPLGVEFSAPPGVALSLFGYRDAVIQNFMDDPVVLLLTLEGKALHIASTSDEAMEVAAPLPEGRFSLGPHRWVHFA